MPLLHRRTCLIARLDCGGIPAPLLQETYLGTATIGCDGYTTQPSSSSCPTSAAALPTPAPPYRNSSTSAAVPGTALPPWSLRPPAPTVTDATVLSGTMGGTKVVETYDPSSYSQFASLTGTVTTTLLDPHGSPQTVIVGPSGVAWAPRNHVSGSGNGQYPSSLAAEPNEPLLTSKGSLLAGQLPSEKTVVLVTHESTTLMETYAPAKISSYASLSSTISTTSLDSKGSPVPILIGPGGLEWTPIHQSSGLSHIPPPSIPPAEPDISATQNLPPASATGTLSSTPGPILPIKTAPTTSVGATPSTAYSSVTGAFDDSAQSETTLIVGSVTEHWTKATFADLSTITAPTTITTPIVQSNEDGSHSTLPPVPIIVGPKGVW